MTAVEIFLLAFGSGIAAGLVLRTELPLRWLLCAGLVGVVLEPTVHANFGPHLFHHSLLASTGAAALVLVFIKVANVILQTWHHQSRRS
jgi:hypothetical protein